MQRRFINPFHTRTGQGGKTGPQRADFEHCATGEPEARRASEEGPGRPQRPLAPTGNPGEGQERPHHVEGQAQDVREGPGGSQVGAGSARAEIRAGST